MSAGLLKKFNNSELFLFYCGVPADTQSISRPAGHSGCPDGWIIDSKKKKKKAEFSSLQSSSVQSLSHVRLFVTPWTAACKASLSITNSQSLLKLMSFELVMPSNHLILCHPLLLPSIFLSIRVFSKESVLCIRWPKYWSSRFSISPSNEYSGLISFSIIGFIFAAQEKLKSLLQYHSSKASILWWSVFFMVQLSLPYVTTGETIALTRWIFVSKIMSLLFNMMSSLIIAWASLVVQLVKNPPSMQGTWVQSLCWEDPLEKGKATHSSILA